MGKLKKYVLKKGGLPPPFGRGGLGVFAFYDVPSRRFAPGFSHFFVFKVHISFSLDVKCHGIRGAQAWVSIL